VGKRRGVGVATKLGFKEYLSFSGVSVVIGSQFESDSNQSMR
jgi:hypothetical protein